MASRIVTIVASAVILSAIAAGSACLCSGPEAAAGASDRSFSLPAANLPAHTWTVAMYWASDNDLDGLTETFVQMWRESMVNTDDLALCVFIDRSDGPANVSTYTEEGWVERIALGEVNSSSPATLQSFLEYVLTEPMLDAQNYMLVIQDHGLGYLGIAVDESEPVRSWMSIDGLGRGIRGALGSTEQDLDIVALDACTLAMVEVAYELRDTASYLVASQLAVPFDGINYRALLGGLSDNACIEPADLACKMVADYADWYSAPLGTYPTLYPYNQDFATLSVIDLSLIAQVGDAFAVLSDELLPKDGWLGKVLRNAATDAFNAMWMNNMGCGFYSDIVTMFGNAADDIRDSHPTVAAACDGLVAATLDAVVDSWASACFKGTCNGLSVFVCPSVGMFEERWDSLERAYDSVGLDFVDVSSWDDVLVSYFTTLKQYGS